MLLPEDRRKRRRIWTTGLSALLAVAAACVWTSAGRIPREIAERAQAALHIAGIAPRVEVAVDGRTLTLSGDLPDPYTRARALAVAGSIRGVRAVVDRIGPAVAQPRAPASLDAPGAPQLAAAAPAVGAAAAPPPDAPAASAPAANPPAAPPSPSGTARSAAAVQTGAPEPADAAGAAPPPARAAETPAAAPVPAEAAPAEGLPPPAPALKFPVLRFDFNRTQVTPASEPLLEEAIALLKKHPGLRVALEGHTDSSGARSYNQRLSERRAAAIAKRLIAAGVDPAQLQTRGHGELQPRAENRSRQGRSLNRRVEMIAIP
ncbi:MAG: OmpA family protein [Desulfobacterales bacterium]|jgi:outer membrane protein OmpA-like peptidoglycan-associated protein|nr:OmpA family protein [Desulfobacterales bacterium]